MQKIVSVIMSVWLLISMASLLFDIHLVEASETIYIKADGSLVGTNKIRCEENVYMLTADIYGSIIIEKDNVIIDGCKYTLTGAGKGNGITIVERVNVTVKNFEIKNFNVSIYIGGYGNSRNNIIFGNNITRCNYGIRMEYSHNNTIIGNRLSNNEYAIYLFASHFNTFRNNIMVGNQRGLAIHGGYLESYTQYVDTTNTVNGKPVYYWITEKDKTVPLDAGYVALIKCTNITVQNLKLTGNGHGILLFATQKSTLNRNMIEDNDVGIQLWDSFNNKISENVVLNNGEGIRIDGIYPAYSQNNEVYRNNITNNDVGIFIFDSSDNVIHRNHITNNECGIRIIGLGGKAADNLIYHNNFVNNTADVPGSWHTIVFQEVWIPPQKNLWDNGKEGNYWSDYITRYPNAREIDSLGIWNTPYNISENNQDNYPLVNPVDIQVIEIPSTSDTTPPTISIISPENKTYTVNNVSLTFTLSEPVSWIGYSLDEQANVTITGNTTLSRLSDGPHSLIVYAKDTSGNIGASEIIYFSIKTQSDFLLITLIVTAIAVIAIGISITLGAVIYKRKGEHTAAPKK